METWSPRWCQHVVGSFERKVDEDGNPARIVVHLVCNACGATHQARCDSGAPISWILRFATGHVHRDVLIDPFPVQEKKP